MKFLSVCLVSLLCFSAAAQAPPAPSVDQTALTTVYITALDKKGKRLPALSAEDFVLLDEKKPPQGSISIRNTLNYPLRLGVLLDLSGAKNSSLIFQEEGLKKFLAAVVGPQDQAFVIRFAGTSNIMRGGVDLEASYTEGNSPKAGAVLMSAIEAYRDEVTKLQDRGLTRRVILIFNRGGTVLGPWIAEKLIALVQRERFTVYCVSSDWMTPNIGVIPNLLPDLAQDSGGSFLRAYDARDFEPVLARLRLQMENQYALSYTPSNFRLDGKFRALSIRPLLDRNLQIVAPKGYYAPNQ